MDDLRQRDEARDRDEPRDDHVEAIEDDASLVEEEAEEQAVEQASGLSSKLIYEVVRRAGDEELERPKTSIVYSGVAAGGLISFSVLGEAIFRTHLPDAEWRYLVENLGYSLGFLIVIMGQMQLFTENTITTVLPVMARPCREVFGRVARLWGIVLAANVVGAFVAAFFFAFTAAIPDELRPAIHELSVHATGMGAWQGFMRAIPAGVLIAAIVWMLPSTRHAAIWLVVIFTWLIAAGDFTHIVAGSVEMAYLLLLGDLGVGTAIFGFFLPVLAGNVIGGSAIFAALAWGQVKDEIKERKERQREERDETVHDRGARAKQGRARRVAS
jgi:formate/nitrite transporter FocA (FNT family)